MTGFSYYIDFLDDRYDALLVAAGTRPPSRLFRRLRKRTDKLIALDGGLNTLKVLGEVPHYVIGDLDSSTPAALEWAKKRNSRIITRSSQEKPDLVKGLEFCRKRKLRNIIVTGIDGDRLDHVVHCFTNSIFYSGLKITLLSARSALLPLSGRVRRRIELPPTHVISWLPAPYAGPCSMSGVKWPFDRRIMKTDGFYSLSNRPVSSVVHIEQQRGRSVLVVGLLPEP